MEIYIKRFGKVFELGKSTIIKIYFDGINVIVHFISFLNTTLTAEDVKTLHEFSQRNIPQVCGDVNGTHIATLSTSSGSKLGYLSQTQKYTINEQVAVASHLLFLDVLAGIPRSFHDAKNFTMGHITSEMRIN